MHALGVLHSGCSATARVCCRRGCLSLACALQAAASDARQNANAGRVSAAMAKPGTVAAWLFGENLADRCVVCVCGKEGEGGGGHAHGGGLKKTGSPRLC